MLNKISVVMSNLNQGNFLELSIQSILNQTYKNFEFIIIDDSSKDNSIEILKFYEFKDNRVKVFFNKTTQGLSKNLNHGIHLSSYDLIFRMDADDIALNNRFEIQLKKLNEDPKLMILGSNINIIDEKNNIIKKSNFPISFEHIKFFSNYINPLAHPSVCMRKSLFSVIGYYNDKKKSSQDYDLWLRAIRANIKIQNIEEVLLNYRIHSNSISNNFFYRQQKDFFLSKNSSITRAHKYQISLLKISSSNRVKLYNKFNQELLFSRYFYDRSYLYYLFKKNFLKKKRIIKQIFKSNISNFNKSNFFLGLAVELYKKNFYLKFLIYLTICFFYNPKVIILFIFKKIR
jgi:glycosyltransferase involved in cell wall biosynthesis